MSKLSKQDKIEIFNLWQNYQVGATELSRRYQVYPSTINYLLTLINRHGTAILDQPYTSYSIAFKEQAIRRVLVKNETICQVSLDLEAELGVKLFSRKSRRLALTPAGQYLLEQAQEILELTAKTKRNIEKDSFVSGSLTIAAGESSGMQRVIDMISDIIKEHPSVKIHLLSGDYSYAELKLNNGTVDFAIIIGDVPLDNYASLTLPEKDTWEYCCQAMIL